MQNFLILRELQTEFLKFKIHFAKISYKEFLIKKTECICVTVYLFSFLRTIIPNRSFHRITGNKCTKHRLYSLQDKETATCKQISVNVNGSRRVKCPSLVFEAMPSLPK